jgi:hypothetical protein
VNAVLERNEMHLRKHYAALRNTRLLKFLSQELMSLLAFKSWIEKLDITQKSLVFREK